MPHAETINLYGIYRDVLRDAHGRVTWDSGWHKNVIVSDCRRLLAALLAGQARTLGIQGIEVGAGKPEWDAAPPPQPDEATVSLADAAPYVLNKADTPHFKLAYLAGSSPSPAPTRRLQIVATLGPNMPAWPDQQHPTATLREFGLRGQLDGQPVLIDYVIHRAIAKDPASTLERTVWLVF